MTAVNTDSTAPIGRHRAISILMARHHNST
jgi:hypothetical protein